MARQLFEGSETAVRCAEAVIRVDPSLERHRPDLDILALFDGPRRSARELIEAACLRYGERACLGERERVYETDGVEWRVRFLPSFRTITYAELWRRVRALAAAWTETGRVRAGDFVANCGFASIDFAVVDLACLYVGAISVPIPTQTPPADLEAIVAETGLRYLACGAAYLDLGVTALRPGAGMTLLVTELDPRDRPAIDRVDALVRTDPRVERLGDLEAKGAHGDPKPASVGAEDLVSILYTSGTTGRPKGVMYLDRTFVHRLSYACNDPPIPWIAVGAMPLNHVTGRFAIYRVMMLGGLTCFVAEPDMSTLFEDIRLVRPTQIMLAPRVTAIVRQHFQAELAHRGGGEDAAKRVMEEMRKTFLGDRLCVLFTGSASTPPETIAFLRECFACAVMELYALNEFGAIAVDWHVIPQIEYKLVGVPELGYFVTDRPFPRGELLVRSPHATAGYFKNPEALAGLFDEDGFVRSGDIVEERGPRHVVCIDRKTNVVKLANGLFVGLSRLEDLFIAGSASIAQMYVHASSERGYVLAVIVPEPKLAQSLDDAALRTLLRGELDRVAREAALPGHEIPRDFLVERTPFSMEAGLLTEAGKRKRPGLKAAYGTRLDALYAEMDGRQVELLARSKSGTMEERTSALVAATLGVAQIDPARSFVELGGDSFGALRLSTLLAQELGANPAVGSLLDPLLSVAELARRLEHEPGRRDRYQDVHGADGETLSASSLRLDRLLPPSLLEQAAARAAPDRPPRSVLLTGAAGFLGRFLLLELLERCVARGGRVVCVVRAPDDAAARARIDRSFASGDAALRDRYAAAAAGHLEVRAGDLMLERFGLDEARYDAWANEIDAVVHNGALVNHAFSYAQLFEPNVVGTAEAIRFALTGKTKSLALVSSTALAAGVDREVTEDDTAGALWPTRPATASFGAYGYVTGKWAAELLVEDLHRRAGAPTQIFRCGTIVAHREYPGVANDGDNVVRLLRGLLWTGVAPRSFYADATRDRHLDGVPVDVVAQAIAAVVLDPESGSRLYHVCNTRRGDHVSLDTFADAVAALRPLVRYDDRQAWLNELRARLEALDDAQRRRSPLANLSRWARPEPDALRLDNRAFRRQLARLLSTDDVPALTPEYIARWLRAL